MDIYSILSSKPHNPHYLNRYIRFIQSCQKVNKNWNDYVEKHHICPKSKDLFPEYKSFSKHSWNCAILTARQHFIAHWILWKTYPDSKSVSYAFWQMIHRINNKIDSKTYAIVAENHKKLISEMNKKKIENGTHHFLGGEIQRKVQKRRLENGTHHFLTNHPNKIQVTCPHCNKTGGATNMKRYHFDNCKKKSVE